MAKIISFFSLKGGVGKTTACANLAVAMGKANIKVLLIDFDANGNLSSNFIEAKFNDGIKKILEKQTIKNVINKNVANNVDLITSSIDTSFMIINNWNQEYESKLREWFKYFKEHYNYVFIDLSASWNQLNKVILTLSDSIIWPIVCTPYAIESVGATLNAIRSIQTTDNPKLKIEGVFINIFEKRTTNSMVIFSEISKTFSQYLYDTIIPQDSLINKLQSDHKTIVGSASSRPSATAFCELAKEIIEKNQIGDDSGK